MNLLLKLGILEKYQTNIFKFQVLRNLKSIENHLRNRVLLNFYTVRNEVYSKEHFKDKKKYKFFS